LGKNDLGFFEFQYDFTLADLGKKAFRIKRALFRFRHEILSAG